MNEFPKSNDRAQSGAPKSDHFPTLRRVGLECGIDPGALTLALARASAALDEHEAQDFPFTPAEHLSLLGLLIELEKTRVR